MRLSQLAQGRSITESPQSTIYKVATNYRPAGYILRKWLTSYRSASACPETSSPNMPDSRGFRLPFSAPIVGIENTTQ